MGNPALGWWIAAGLLVAGELATGTFYLLMLAVGCAAAALAGHAGAGLVAQTSVAALFGGGAVAAWRRKRLGTPPRVRLEANPDVNLDVGEQVQVEAWDADGTARIHYRGTSWRARFTGDGVPAPGAHVIDEVRHNELALRRAA